jgi:hypothetical protein
MPDEYQPGWHHVGVGDMTGFLIAYGAVLLVFALVAAGLWLAHRRSAARNAPVHRWPTASLANPSPQWRGPQWPEDEGRLRASHADRDQAMALLRQATADGYLTLDEFEERLGKVYSARYLRDLDPLVDDIPCHPRPAALQAAPDRPGRPVHDWGWRPLPVRSHPLSGGAWIVFAIVILTVALHAWWLPFWPVLLVFFLVLRAGRHHRRGVDGRWGSRV